MQFAVVLDPFRHGYRHEVLGESDHAFDDRTIAPADLVTQRGGDLENVRADVGVERTALDTDGPSRVGF